jgi:ATP-dependent Lon protease
MKKIADSRRRVSDQEARTTFHRSKEYEVPAMMQDNLVLFPKTDVITVVKDKASLSAVRESLKQHRIVACIPSCSRKSKGTIATLATIMNIDGVENDAGLNVELEGMWRIRIKKFIRSAGSIKVKFQKVEESSIVSSTDTSLLMKKVQDQIDEFTKLIPIVPHEIVALLKEADTPGDLADMCANSPNFTLKNRVDLLCMLDQVERLRRVSRLLEKQLTSMRKMEQVVSISNCEECIELADRAFESDPSKISEIAISFLNHVFREHTGEVLALLIEKYGPIFLNKRLLR